MKKSIVFGVLAMFAMSTMSLSAQDEPLKTTNPQTQEDVQKENKDTKGKLKKDTQAIQDDSQSQTNTQQEPQDQPKKGKIKKDSSSIQDDSQTQTDNPKELKKGQMKKSTARIKKSSKSEKNAQTEVKKGKMKKATGKIKDDAKADKVNKDAGKSNGKEPINDSKMPKLQKKNANEDPDLNLPKPKEKTSKTENNADKGADVK